MKFNFTTFLFRIYSNKNQPDEFTDPSDFPQTFVCLPCWRKLNCAKAMAQEQLEESILILNWTN